MAQTNVTQSSIGAILDETQGHLILRWDAWRSTQGFSEVSLSVLYCLLALFFLVYFATESFLRQQTWHARMLLLFAVLTICCFVYLRLTEDKKTTNTFIVILLGVLCLFLLYTGGIGGTGPLWYFVFSTGSAVYTETVGGHTLYNSVICNNAACIVIPDIRF